MKKLNRILSLSAAAALALSLSACGAQGEPVESGTAAPAAGETYKVAVIKQMDHASLDEIANAITARLDAIAEENGITIEYEVTSGQGDQTVLRQLSDQAIADGVDAIIPIATTAAQVAAVSAEESKTPVIFAAISYPETVELTGMDYVTGTSDALDTNQILDMMFTQNPDIGSVGLLYSLSEPNSEVPIADAKAYLDAKGVAYTEATANTNDEVIAAASSLIADGVDAVFTPTDNIIMAAELAIYDGLHRRRHPPLHRGRLLRAQRRLCHLRRQLHRPGCRNGRSGLPGHDRGHGRPGGLLPGGGRPDHRQLRDRRRPGHRPRRL